MVTLEELEKKVEKFCKARDWDQFHSAKELAISLVTESSELLEKFHFKEGGESESVVDKKREEVGEELADLFYVLLRFSRKYGFDLAEELDRKLKKNAEKYPVSKAKGSNKKYTEY